MKLQNASVEALHGNVRILHSGEIRLLRGLLDVIGVSLFGPFNADLLSLIPCSDGSWGAHHDDLQAGVNSSQTDHEGNESSRCLLWY